MEGGGGGLNWWWWLVGGSSRKQERELILRGVGVDVIVEIDGVEMDTGAALEGSEEGGGHVGANPVGHSIELVAG